MNLHDLLLLSKITGGSSGGGGGGDTPSGGEEWIGDGKTHIWISLQEGRTSPRLGCCPNGTVTVDWGDGTTPDVLTGTSVGSTKWTPTHNYASAGDYVITLAVDGTMGLRGTSSINAGSEILRHSTTSDYRNLAYVSAVKRIELGDDVTYIGSCSFYQCYNLTSVAIPDSVTIIDNLVFKNCANLTGITIPDSVTRIGDGTFSGCRLTSVIIPDSVTSINNSTFSGCTSLTSITIPDSVTSIGSNVFDQCYGLTIINIPDSVTSIGYGAFNNCYSLASIRIPDGVTSIGTTTFNNCYSLAKIRFEGTTPPVVANSNAFSNVPTDCVISVPVGSLEAYTTATNYPDPAKYTYVEE